MTYAEYHLPDQDTASSGQNIPQQPEDGDLYALLFEDQGYKAPNANIDTCSLVSPVGLAPDVLAPVTQAQIPLPTNLAFPWDQLAAHNPSLSSIATPFQFFTQAPGSASFLSNTAAHNPQAATAYAMMQMAQPALFQQWAQQNGLYGNLSYAGIGTPQHSSISAPLQADFASALGQFVPPMHRSVSSVLGDSPTAVLEPVHANVPGAQPALITQSLPSSSTSPSLPPAPFTYNFSAYSSSPPMSSHANHTTSQSVSGTASDFMHSPPGDMSPSMPSSTQQPTTAGDHANNAIPGGAANDLSPVVPHANHAVRFATGPDEINDQGSCDAAAAAAVDTTSARPQRHRRAPTNPDGTRPVNLPGSRVSSAIETEHDVDTSSNVGPKRKRSGSGVDVRKRKSV